MTAPATKFDPEKVMHVLRGYRARLDAQRLVAQELESIADDARREYGRQVADFRDRVAAWRGHGVEIPAGLADPDGDEW